MTTTALTTRNATLGDLAAMLQDQHARKLDVIVPATALRSVRGSLVVSGADPVVDDDGVTDANGSYRPTDVCDEHVANKLGIPLPYLRKMRTDRVDLLDANVNGWLHGTPADTPSWYAAGADDRSFMLRTFRSDETGDGVARALLSNRYRTFDNLDVLTAALEGVRDAGVDVEIDGCDLSDRRMYVRVKAPQVRALAPTLLAGYRSPFSGASGDENPVVFAGFVIANSEVGAGAFTITPRIIVEICTNGVTLTKDALRNVHLGQQLDDGVVRWSGETQQRNLELVKSQARDAVSTFLDVDYVTDALQRLEAKAGVPVEQPQKLVESVGKSLKFSQERIDGVLDHFIRGGQMTAGGVLNAVTSYAQTIDDADVAAEIEAAGIPALELAAR